MQQEQQVVGTKIRPVRCTDSLHPEAAKKLIDFIEAKIAEAVPLADHPLTPEMADAFYIMRNVIRTIAETAEAAPQGWREQITIEAHY